jgi:hypothetical protein
VPQPRLIDRSHTKDKKSDMAELFWEFQQYELSEASEGIGEVYSGLVNEMQNQGWKGVQHQQDVHGYKQGADLFAVVFLPIAGRKFWQGVAVGDAGSPRAQVAESAGLVAVGLQFGD